MWYGQNWFSAGSWYNQSWYSQAGGGAPSTGVWFDDDWFDASFWYLQNWFNPGGGGLIDLAATIAATHTLTGTLGDTGIAGGGTDLVRLSAIRLRADVKVSRDWGEGTSSAGGLVTVTFNKVFADIRNLTVTPYALAGDDKLYPVIVFVDAPDPTDFEFEVRDSGGTRVVRDFKWEASGVLKNG